MEKIAIIIPIYNVEEYLSKCLDSVINQTYKNIEIICINDGSTDNSLQILEKYAQKDYRIKIINQKNQGVSVARNKGLKIATGDYVWFIDGDDYIEKNACEQLYEIIKKTNTDIVLFGANTINNHTIKQWLQFDIDFINLFDNKALKFNDIFKPFISNYKLLSCCDKLYKLNYIKDKQVFFDKNLKYAEDTFFVINLLLQNPNVYLLNKNLYNYVLHGSSATHKDSYKMFLGHFDFENRIRKLININAKSAMSEFLFEYLLSLYISFWNELYFSKNKKNYIQHLKSYICFGQENRFDTKRAKKHLLLAKLHLSWWYWKLIRPIGKYCIVLPYRRFREFLRSNNG